MQKARLVVGPDRRHAGVGPGNDEQRSGLRPPIGTGARRHFGVHTAEHRPLAFGPRHAADGDPLARCAARAHEHHVGIGLRAVVDKHLVTGHQIEPRHVARIEVGFVGPDFVAMSFTALTRLGTRITGLIVPTLGRFAGRPVGVPRQLLARHGTRICRGSRWRCLRLRQRAGHQQRHACGNRHDLGDAHTRRTSECWNRDHEATIFEEWKSTDQARRYAAPCGRRHHAA
ncbi:hypothetical protein GALL_544920 [mine drainage metagenome]|uniref:Uncharacterized protein n=1 Tax=mine drainage metagenome TaxID=410659 RepID=A0A1J5P085_9ZZZZ